jgi:hypothetical protein
MEELLNKQGFFLDIYKAQRRRYNLAKLEGIMNIINELKSIKDRREYNGKEYQLWQIVLFSIETSTQVVGG